MPRGDDDRRVAERLFAIADAFERGDELTLSEIAERAGLPMSTAHRLRGEWVAWGGITRSGDGRYRVGIKLWRLAVRQPSSRRLRIAAKPYLEDLFQSTGEHVHLAVREGLGAVYLERMSGADAVPSITDIGSRLPLHATGVGQALLAFAPPGVFEDVIAAGPRRFLPGTIVDEDALRERMVRIRAAGIATSVEALTKGAFSVAAPVRDATGDVVAAVSIIAHVERLEEPQFALGVRIAGRGISAALGHRP